MNKTSSQSKITVFLLVLLVIGCMTFSIYSYLGRPKIAFVRTAELIYSYNGMRDAHSSYKAQTDIWQANIDTLRMQYQKCVADYQSTYKTLTEKERGEKQALIKKLEDNLKNYSQVVREQADQKEKSMTDAVLNQINSYAEEYAKKKGYDFVLGGANGNLLYGNKAYDITDEVLQALNKEYRLMPQQPTTPQPPAQK